ncbi:hypothetical protein CPC735_004260 [Coccidioides posadasii C735 delta SOWgp]|uniref:Polyprenal reductase n=1 Tax=Coccidioides posadasii (strain C735) TaxID=222929 RepID=C5P943_COCP7|nr:hypothetical protein CPC735_004260 [Coccidioides posadasii C735 delta SOWgp]EER26255.1 hypothetical protein CPC735_004260 [Coccidioides posadasii C735 delta SOWgp]|eukprot:XP_003068400.1 hypothetical protein CPC735_004260 [Coccidioides posadasii C735 delta SOWgp]
MECKWAVPSLDVADLLRSGFLTAGAAVRAPGLLQMRRCMALLLTDWQQILAANSIPMLRGRFIPYGARSGQPSSGDGRESDPKATSNAPPSASSPKHVLDYMATWNVPHSHFMHFYIVSVLSSLLWALQLATRGPLFRAVAVTLNERNLRHAMSPGQVVLCWALLAIQGARRLYECITLTRPSASKMWFGHWLFGLGFYASMSVAIWIEGTATLLSSNISLDDASLVTPSMKTMIFLPVFLIASGIQYDCHCYLASLKKYTLPEHPAFVRLVCPHYTAECAIYLALSFLAAPKGELVNKTVFSGLLLVMINLGVSAGVSKDWYARRFGADQVESKWKMIPRVY